MDINNLITYVKEHNASDVILSSSHPPSVRISGDIHMLRVAKLTAVEVENVINSLLSSEQQKRFREELDLDFSIEIQNQRFRANAFTTSHGPTLALRTINDNIRTLKELMVPNIVERFTHLKRGLVIITGPTGSGKSSTLAAIINHINHEQSKHIITIEDPIEYKFVSDKSLIHQREVGLHTNSFASALKAALRENPDIIMLGELRDIETIQLALTAAETGHLVFCTLHTSSAAKTMDRIIDVFPAGDKPMIRTMLATSLEAVVSQMLLPLDGKKGRIAAFEVMLANSAIRNLIRENKIHQISSIMQISTKHGMIMMEQSIKSLFEHGYVSESTAKEYLIQLQEKENDKKTDATSGLKMTQSYEDNEF